MTKKKIQETEVRSPKSGDETAVRADGGSADGSLSTAADPVAHPAGITCCFCGSPAVVVRETSVPTEMGQTRITRMLRCRGPHHHQYDQETLMGKPQFVFPKVNPCPRCAGTGTRAVSTQGQNQYRQCQTPGCRHHFTVIGRPVA